jgi:superfamily I DNA/RNA helicase
VNPDDDVSLLRVINNPPRGISNATVSLLTDHCIAMGCSIYAGLRDPSLTGLLSQRAQSAVGRFLEFLALYSDVAAQPQTNLGDLADRLLKEIGYVPAMKRACKSEDEAASREQNLREVIEALHRHRAEKKGGLSEFLESVALDDSKEEEDDDLEKKKGVSLITLHAAKGLEFPIVYLVGLEEGILPHKRALEEEQQTGRDEERRLLYVGITRAMEKLTLSYCGSRTRYGSPVPCQPSSFIRELDPAHVEETTFAELANQPATEAVSKAYFGMMKEMLGATGDEPVSRKDKPLPF